MVLLPVAVPVAPAVVVVTACAPVENLEAFGRLPPPAISLPTMDDRGHIWLMSVDRIR